MGEQLGFIGLGIMGQAMARNLCGDEPLIVYNRSARGLEKRPLTASVADTPRAVAEASQVVFLMLSNDDAIRAVVDGNHGVFAGLRPGTVIVDHSTVSPRLTRAVAHRAAEMGASWLDAPVTGGDIGAREGTLTIMVGGSIGDFERVTPYLKRMGQRVSHVGEVGQGQSLKLVANMVSAMNLMAASEGIQLGLQLGLRMDDLAEVMTHGSAQSFELAKVLDRYRNQNYAPGFSVENRDKDLRLAIELAEEVQFGTPLGQRAKDLMHGHSETGFSQYDESSYILSLSNKKEE